MAHNAMLSWHYVVGGEVKCASGNTLPERVSYENQIFFWPCGILVPPPGIEPTPPAVEAWSLNHWTAREVRRM